nr:neuron navigator 3 [Cavia porcellus]
MQDNQYSSSLFSPVYSHGYIEIRNGNLKAILGLFFSLSRYKQQQHRQQQYYQSLVELQQGVTHTSPPPEPSQVKTQQDMQSSLTARYATQSNHSGIATSQKKPTRLPGPSRVSAAGSSSSKAQGASNLNRRSQSFNSIDKNKPPNYANGNEKVPDSSKGPAPSSGVNGNMQPPSTAGQPPASAIPSPSASKPWRSKSMNVKHSATSTMLTVKQASPATSPTPSSDRLKPPVSEGVKPAPSGQKSMLEKFKLVNARTALRPPQSPSSGSNDGGKDDDVFSECSEMEGFNSGLNSGGSTNSSPKVSPKLAPPKAGSKNLSNKKSLLQPKEKEEKNRDKNKICTEKPVKEEKDQVIETAPKKTSKIASLIPKGSKTTAAKKESLIPSSSGIPKPGSKVPTAKQTISPSSTASKESEKFRTTKGSPSHSLPKPIATEKTSTYCPAPLDGREAGQASLCTVSVQSSSQSTGNGAVQLPQQQQQHSHPNTATVAPFIYSINPNTQKAALPASAACSYRELVCHPQHRAVGVVYPAASTAAARKSHRSENAGGILKRETLVQGWASVLNFSSYCALMRKLYLLHRKESLRRTMQRSAELSVFRSKEVKRKGACLQKQKSLTNLSLSGEGERRPTVRISNWFGNAAKASQREAQYAERHSLSRFLSRSVQSLYHSSSSGSWSFLPAGGSHSYSEDLEDWSTRRCLEGDSDEDSRSEDENASSKPSSISRSWAEEEGESCLREGTAHLDEEVILTMLGDLEQALYSDLLGEDPETRRMRTVKNIADLRQNLEETMSSLRGTQISHSTLETTFDSTVTTEVNGRTIPNLTGRPTPMTWRLGQASPRLQAGDAPSMGAGYPRSGTSRFIHTDPSRFMYTTPLRRAAVSRLGNMSQMDMSEKASSDLDMSSEVDVGGYMSDGDILGKSLRSDDINSGYMTDGGLSLYTRSLNRVPDTTTSRDVIQRGVHDVTVDADSWDDSSSVSSGLSDTLDNISTDDLNTTSSVSSYSNITVPSRKSTQLKTDSEKRSTADDTWDSPEEVKKPEEDFDSPGDGGGKWKGSSSSGAPEDVEKAGQKGSLAVSQTGSWRRGMSAHGGAPARQKAGTSALKTPGKTDDAKASEKGKTPLKGSSLQRSPSDAGKSSGDEGKKPPSGIGRSTATSSFGFKKPSGVGSSTMITSSGATITSGSATLGKIPKSAAIGGKSNAGRKTSLDGSQNQDDVVLHVSSKTTLQYRSLPRPSKSSTSGIPGRGGHRSSTSSIDSNVSSKSAGATTSKLREPTKIGSGRSSPVTVNQTDKEKEKVAVSDSESVSLSGSPKSSPTSATACGTQGLRQPGSKYPDIASPTFRRLFGAKAGGKSASAPSTEGVKSSSVVPSPSTTLARQGSLESPSSGTGSMGSAGGLSGGSSPLFNKPSDLTTDVISLSHSLASSPASVHSFTSGGLVWAANLSSSSAGSKDTPSYQSMTSLHTSSESIDLPLSHHGSLSGLTTGTHEVQSLLMRTGSVRSTLSESMQLDRNTLPKKGLRYTPSSRQANQEEGKEWLRSHSTGGLQDTGNQSPLVSPSAMSSSTTGKYHFSNLVSPTNLSQFNLPGPTMMRSNSIPAQDSSFDLYDDSQLCGSATSLEERPRAISHSGSFRDSMEEVHGSSLSLVSSTSSLYSTAEEKAHSEQIHKLRRELVASQEKVATLTSQLSANAHLVAAFEKSLGNMTGRLQSLTMTAEQKESELIELRETIEMLKAQNSAAQAAIQGALNGPDHPPKDLRIRRQHSSESVSSINSATSHSSIGSGNDADSKKKKKKNWVNSRGSELRSSFKQAFGKKKSTKPPSSHSDIEELTDSSLPASPKLPHNAGDCGSTSMKPSHSASAICECTEAEAEIILQLKSELREKELKLTDIRLEALSSAHHLDQIREAMNRMQNEIEILKAENDRLKAETGNAAKPTRPPSESASSTSSSSSRQSLGLSLNNLNITESVTSDILLDDAGDTSGHKDGRSVKIIVSISKGYGRSKICFLCLLKELQQYLANLAEQCSADNNGVELPVVIILDNLHHVGSLSDIFNGFLNCKYNKCPYIIGTMNQGVSSSPNLELHHNFRWVLCANHTEPVKGFLGRYLRRKLIELEIERNIRNNDLVKIIDWIPKTWHHLNSFLETHSSSDVTIGPRLFLPCPMDVEGSRVWFMDLWNYSLVPYILEAVREGLQMYGKRAPWEDPSRWVLDTYPWGTASLQQEGPALLELRPEDVGYEGCTSTKEATTSKHIPQTDTEGDPLMNMLMKLQEAANYSGTQSCDSDSTSHHEDILDSSLESTL